MAQSMPFQVAKSREDGCATIFLAFIGTVSGLAGMVNQRRTGLCTEIALKAAGKDVASGAVGSTATELEVPTFSSEAASYPVRVDLS
ncbi:MAG: hypothetical protein M1835_003534 [Candelina submexicana]|nr:MAG: hypothetical protein M1835_003534 [Candelina submexicana]